MITLFLGVSDWCNCLYVDCVFSFLFLLLDFLESDCFAILDVHGKNLAKWGDPFCIRLLSFFTPIFYLQGNSNWVMLSEKHGIVHLVINFWFIWLLFIVFSDLWALLVGSSSSCCFTIQKSFQEHMMMCQHGVENTGYTQV